MFYWLRVWTNAKHEEVFQIQSGVRYSSRAEPSRQQELDHHVWSSSQVADIRVTAAGVDNDPLEAMNISNSDCFNPDLNLKPTPRT